MSEPELCRAKPDRIQSSPKAEKQTPIKDVCSAPPLEGECEHIQGWIFTTRVNFCHRLILASRERLTGKRTNQSFAEQSLTESNYPLKQKNRHPLRMSVFLVGDAGFGPAKSLTTDLQSAPFGRSGNPPFKMLQEFGAGERSRTINLLITNQLLCH